MKKKHEKTAKQFPFWLIDGCVLGLAVFLPVSIAGANVFWGAGFALWLGMVLWNRRSKNIQWTGLEIPWLLMVAVEIVTSLASDNPARSLRILRTEVLVGVFILSSQTGDRKDVLRRLGTFCFMAGVAGVYGVAQWQGWLEGLSSWAPSWLVVDEVERATGFYRNPITYAEILLMAGTVALGLWRTHGGRFWFGVFIASFVGVGVSQTRGVWLSLLFSLSLWAWVKKDRRVLSFLGILVLAGVLMVGFSPSIKKRVVSLTDTQTNQSNRTRMGLWLKSIESIRDHPWLGIGAKNFAVTTEELRWGANEPGKVWKESHNMYLQMAVERGLPGLAVFLWFLWVVGRRLWRVSRSDPASLGVFFGFMGLLVAGLTETWTNDSEVVMVFLFLVGSVCRLEISKNLEISPTPVRKRSGFHTIGAPRSFLGGLGRSANRPPL